MGDGLIGGALAIVAFFVISVAAGMAAEEAERRVDIEKLILICAAYMASLAVLTLMVTMRTPKGF